MDYFNCLDAFVRVAEVGNFSEVARQLRVSKSVVTSRIKQLEAHVEVPLFHRSTRNVSLSQVGQLYYDECAQLVSRANEIVDGMRSARQAPTGLLRVHGLPGLVVSHMARFLTTFSEKYPGISFDFVVNDEVIDPVKAGYDCALQIFAPISDDLIQRKLFPVHRTFCASPAYLGIHEPIAHPIDLTRHALGLYSRYPSRDKWVFENGEKQCQVELSPAFKSNSVHFLKEIALEGLGVVCLPTIACAEDINEGRLVPVLTDYWLSSYWLSAVYPKTQRNSVRLKLFLDELTLAFPHQPGWDEILASKVSFPPPNAFLGD
ncbi:LysR family transcriptional regulator [Pollutimonas subterranea]|nr:LysR family transcriptional regulator [Pollutimonas subterranea]